MTLFLASVRDAAEAELALGAGADIIDLKDTTQGALGALAPGDIAACVGRIEGRALLSATVGDLPLTCATRAAVLATAALGVDYVKLGVFPAEHAARSLEALEIEAAEVRLILVLFADALIRERASQPTVLHARIGDLVEQPPRASDPAGALRALPRLFHEREAEDDGGARGREPIASLEKAGVRARAPRVRRAFSCRGVARDARPALTQPVARAARPRAR